MTSQEIGFLDLTRFVLGSWKLIVGLALAAALLTAVGLSVLLPDRYAATARLIVRPELRDSYDQAQTTIGFYRELLVSDSIIEQTTQKLIGDGVLPEGTILTIGRDLLSRSLSAGTDDQAAILTVTATYGEPEVAAKMANVWAEVFLASCRAMVGSRAEASANVLGDELSPTRQELERLEEESKRHLDEFQEKEEEASTSWDRKIAAVKERTETAVASHQAETRRLLDQSVNEHLAADGGAVPEDIRSFLLEIVSTRTQLAQTPRVLTLEKAASDETLADLIVAGQEADDFDRTLVSQEINPLYDQLTVSLLELESEAKRRAQLGQVQIAALLVELEEIQLRRAASLAALLDHNNLELRILRRRRSRNLEELRREQAVVTAKLHREIERLGDLETQLATKVNQSYIATLLENVDPVVVAAPAVPRQLQASREIPTKATAAAFVGALLGLTIALFRSVAGS